MSFTLNNFMIKAGAILKTKWAKTIIVTALILLDFYLAGVTMTLQLIMIIALFSYLGISGILYRTSKKKNKIFTFLNFMILLQKWIAYFFMILIILGIVVQLYYKFKF